DPAGAVDDGLDLFDVVEAARHVEAEAPVGEARVVLDPHRRGPQAGSGLGAGGTAPGAEQLLEGPGAEERALAGGGLEVHELGGDAQAVPLLLVTGRRAALVHAEADGALGAVPRI